MGYNLFIDDERRPKDALYFNAEMHVVERPLVVWIIVRNYNQFVEIITQQGLPSIISFDHDLADEHYKEGIAGKPPTYSSYKEKTGFDCAKWLVEYCLAKNLALPIYYCHSFNPEGRINIISILNSYKKHYDNLHTKQ